METALDGSATMLREDCRPSMKDTKSLLDIPPPFSFLLSMEVVGLGEGEEEGWRGLGEGEEEGWAKERKRVGRRRGRGLGEEEEEGWAKERKRVGRRRGRGLGEGEEEGWAKERKRVG